MTPMMKYILFLEFFYYDVNENYQFYLHETVNEDELRKMLVEYDEVKHATNERIADAWYYDTNNERGVVTGVQQWNSDHRGSCGEFLTIERYISVIFQPIVF